MSKQQIKKFRKNDYSYDDDEDYYSNNPKSFVDKRKEKRVERALRTKDISALTEEDGLDPLDVEDEIWDDEYQYEDRR
jgi:hypothetical protein